MTTTLDAPVLRAATSLTSDDLLRFLAAQRWYSAKGATAAGARITDLVPMPWGDGAFAIALVAADLGSARRDYQVPLALRSSLPPGAPASAALRRGDAGVLYDAVYDDGFRRGLAEALARGTTVRTPSGLSWTAEPAAGRAVVLEGESRVGTAEQSNTSLVFGDRIILKLFRSLVAGVQPDVEMTDFLTNRARFAHTPALLGTIRIERNGESMIAGMAQAYLPESRDAWSYALERAAPYFAAPIDEDPVNPFTGDARALGEITRAMHEALASDATDAAFAPEPAGEGDLEHWVRATQRMIGESLTLLERQVAAPGVPAEHAAEARALVRRRAHYVGWIDEIADAIGTDLGRRIRVHGDYHLGQVLRARDGAFMIIDFEGEPLRPLAERREKASPLRDAAGMLRSIAYAAAIAATRVPAGRIDPRTREIRTARWERDVRAAFLAGYFARRESAGMLPSDETHARRLITLFETEKAFYELAYELSNRPAWVWVPMRGIAKLFTR